MRDHTLNNVLNLQAEQVQIVYFSVLLFFGHVKDCLRYTIRFCLKNASFNNPCKYVNICKFNYFCIAFNQLLIYPLILFTHIYKNK